MKKLRFKLILSRMYFSTLSSSLTRQLTQSGTLFTVLAVFLS